MDELRDKAEGFLRSPCIISGPGRFIISLVRRYAGGESLSGAESQQQLSTCLATTQRAIAMLQGTTTYPELDQLAFYERAAAILHDIQTETTASP